MGQSGAIYFGETWPEGVLRRYWSNRTGGCTFLMELAAQPTSRPQWHLRSEAPRGPRRIAGVATGREPVCRAAPARVRPGGSHFCGAKDCGWRSSAEPSESAKPRANALFAFGAEYGRRKFRIGAFHFWRTHPNGWILQKSARGTRWIGGFYWRGFACCTLQFGRGEAEFEFKRAIGRRAEAAAWSENRAEGSV